ncbi:unnamed protein product [Phytophthora fragariaefolia]|uniref:Unnamed protein product n=1 Tax=Phytophthora fragariaefolia TaxID=1490495 RepID=A0A9W7D707_9STRA|nr:unnamed protein product [Phytophthora fragariaefolia]
MSGFVVGVPATKKDRLTECYMRDGYDGLETLVFIKTLSDEDIQDRIEIINPKLSFRTERLVPRSAEALATVPELWDLLSRLDARRELASLLQHYPVEVLTRKHWKEDFLVSKRQLDQEVADPARDFKRAEKIHEQKEEALRSRLKVVTRERDDVFPHARSLKDQLKADSLNISTSNELPESTPDSGG